MRTALMSLCVLTLCSGCKLADLDSESPTHTFAALGVFLPEGSGGARRGGFAVGGYKFVKDTTSVGGIGFYGNVKLGGDLDGADRHYNTITPNTFGDPEVDRHRLTAVANLGATWMFADLPNVGLYGGIGIGWWDEKIELDDPTNILGDTYTVDGPSDTGVNGNFGALVALNEGLGLFVEYDTFPEAFSVGAAFHF